VLDKNGGNNVLDMEQQIQLPMTGVAYCSSIGCIIAGWLEVLGTYATGIGVVLAIVTFAMDQIYKNLKYRRDKNK
jgi:hypothetical protein